MKKNKKIAIMYDFDKTLSPKDMQEFNFISDIGIKDPAEFWAEANEMALSNDMDRILVSMYMMIKKAQDANIRITRDAFVKLGKGVELFRGVDTWFTRVNDYCREHGFEAEHYIISSGIKEIIEGTSIADEFKRIFASAFYYDANDVAKWPAFAVNYQSKVQFLYRINKGVLDITDDSGLNEYLPEASRRISFRRMIYIGDGYTDVPCMKLVKQNGGFSICVYKRGSAESREISDRLLCDGRVNFIAQADYSEKRRLEKLIFSIINKIEADEVLREL